MATYNPETGLLDYSDGANTKKGKPAGRQSDYTYETSKHQSSGGGGNGVVILLLCVIIFILFILALPLIIPMIGLASLFG